MFWAQFWPQLLATVVGLVLGVPIAFGISRHQERKKTEERKKKIIQAIHQELEINRENLSYWLQDIERKYPNQDILTYQLRDQTWKAFSEGGEIEWIKDPALLNLLADSYYRVSFVNYVSDRYFQLKMVSFSSDEVSGWTVKQYFDKLMDTTISARDEFQRVMESLKTS